jgi:hypothetical protein
MYGVFFLLCVGALVRVCSRPVPSFAGVSTIKSPSRDSSFSPATLHKAGTELLDFFDEKVQKFRSFAFGTEQKETQTQTFTNTPEDIQFMNDLTQHNEQAMEILQNLMKPGERGWAFVNEKDGVTVEKRFLKAGSFVSKKDRDKGNKHACVKSVGIIDASPERVFRLFLDNTRVFEFNENCVLLKDVMQLSPPPSNPSSALGKMAKKVDWAKVTGFRCY